MSELFKAIEEQDVVKVKALLADSNINLNYSRCGFFKACEKGNLEIVQALLNDDRVDYHAITYHGSALDMAFVGKNGALFRLLINHPKIEIEKMRWSQMHADFALGDIEKCMQYIKQFDEGIIDLNQQTKYSKLTPLHIVCQMSHIEIAKLLINHPKD